MIIKSHRDLANAIEGKRILLLNSLGKDSALCLAWLTAYAKPAKVVSLFFERFTVHPDELKYHDYQKRRYPLVEFLTLPDPNELTMILEGVFQPPEMLAFLEEQEYDGFDRGEVVKEIVREHHIDLVCDGQAGYEGMGRAQRFHKKGLLIGNTIYPIGLMKKADIVGLVKTLGIRLNPTYKFYGSTFDEICYYRMRSAMKANPAFEQLVLKYFPLAKLDKFRWEVVIHGLKEESRKKTESTKGAQAAKA